MRGPVVTKRVLLGVMMLLFGGVLAFGGGRAVLRAWTSGNWPTAQGSVLASSVETMRSKRSVSFRPHVRYSYTVGSTPYTSQVISFAATDTGDLQEAREYVSRFPAGSHVEPRYAPDDPTVACLDCGRAGVADYVVAVGGVGMALFAVVGLLELLRSHQAAQRRQQRSAGTGATSQQATRG
jgi:TRAP-type C4-dicarboxylate transport system permease small subunit